MATPENTAKLQKLGNIAQEWDLEINQLVLIYTFALRGMGPVIPASSSVQQLESNARAGNIQFSEAQCTQGKQIIG